MEKLEDNEQKNIPEDIMIFLKQKKGGLIINSLSWWGPIRSRILGLAALNKKYLTYKNYFELLLPAKYKDTEKIEKKLDYFLNKEIKNEYPGYLNDLVNFFGKPFGGPSYNETISLVHDVAFLDQYNARKLLKQDSVIIDVGANIGVFSVLAANIAKNGKVFSFEPVKNTYEALVKNSKPYPNIKTENLGLGDVTAKKNIYVNSLSTGISTLEDSHIYKQEKNRNREGKIEIVQIVTLDSFVTINNINRVDFIKIDTEGYESKVLEGAIETIKKSSPIIAMSAYHKPEDKEELPKLLKSINPNYICKLYKSAEEDFICYVPSL